MWMPCAMECITSIFIRFGLMLYELGLTKRGKYRNLIMQFGRNLSILFITPQGIHGNICTVANFTQVHGNSSFIAEGHYGHLDAPY